jgi:hypothetical protein
MVSRRWSGCQPLTATVREVPAPPAPEPEPASVRLRSVTANVPPAAAVSVCRPARSVSVLPVVHSRTCSGRYPLSSPSVPLTAVR